MQNATITQRNRKALNIKNIDEYFQIQIYVIGKYLTFLVNFLAERKRIF